MIMATHSIPITPVEGEKPDIEHVESTKLPIDDPLAYDGHGLVKSRFDDMSITKTLWVFRRAVFFTLCVYTGYMCEGFEVSPGSLAREPVGLH